MPGQRLDEFAQSIDKNVGARIRQRRLLIGMSQGRLGELIGVTFQQVQRYENAKNRVSASTLFMIAGELNVTPAFFFEGEANAAAIERASDIARFVEAMPPEVRDIYRKTGELLANIPWQRD